MMTVKQAVDNWSEYIKLLIESTSINPEESEESIAGRKAKLEADPEKWFRYYFPKYSYAQPAPFHLEATKRVLSKQEWYEVRIWSRELAKSTRTMMEVLYMVLVGHKAHPQEPIPVTGTNTERVRKKYCLLISNSFDNATRLLMPYKANLESNQRLIQDYGNQVTSGKWQASEFTTESGTSFRALGAGQSPRGTRNEETRPDILLFDDIDTDVDCLNPDIVAKKWRWIEEAAIGTRSVSQPATIIFCGNLIARESCMARAIAFADVTDKQNIRNKKGFSNWSAKNTEAHIDRILAQKSYASAQKEYFNNPVIEGSVFPQMSYKPPLPIGKYEDLICYTDPSFSEKGDYKATVLVGKCKREYHVLKAFVEQTTVDAMFDWHLQIIRYTSTSRKCRYYMEANFVQDTILNQLTEKGRRTGQYINLQGDKRQKPHKYTRIESQLEPLNRNGELYLNEEERYNPHMVRLAEQFTAFSQNSSAHDDGPDAVEGAIWILQQNAKNNAKDVLACGKKLRNNRL